MTAKQSLHPLTRTPAFVLRKGSCFYLRNLTSNVGFLGENGAEFYSGEIICGLERFHAMHIVHLDTKPNNMLLLDSGHNAMRCKKADFDGIWTTMAWGTGELSSSPSRLIYTPVSLCYQHP
ncbi:Phototropin-2 [Echinococcus granulosus]|uniref:Phototropin-2 n=1 Tax=Echinococcus granulosus TaxID=6210 RepID=W6UAW6_ECHGR|nr:Phototropin-2 [Echinococcus granulosus]EUB58508.1 Phototropin-2 [Echinococcus granulosus]